MKNSDGIEGIIDWRDVVAKMTANLFSGQFFQYYSI